ncbi:hypothetical protein N9P79_00185 [Crocinitomicaceae bacterium]|nr:hypothetical protein [Crocinitomicaceae bacterium]
MSINYLDTQNQDNLLFKKFQGVAQANINTDTALVQYSSEQRKALVNVFNSSIFSNEVPVDLSENYWVSNLDAALDVSASLWIGSGSTNQTVGQMQNISKTPIPGTDLVFYKQVYLEPLAATNQAWFCRDPSSADPQSYSIENNLLKDSIPFLYNDKEPTTYTPIVYYNDATSSPLNWVPQQQNVPNSLNWVFDSASGILQFYQNDTTLNDLNINKTGLDASGNPIEGKRPRISFIKYKGPKGAGGSGGGGGGISDASYNQLVQDICANTVLIEDISGQLNRYLFEIPEAPTDGSFNVADGVTRVTLGWTNPPQKRAALDFYQNINLLYPSPGSYPDLTTLQDMMNYLPFHNTLKIQYRSRNNAIPPEISSWVDASPCTINNSNQGPTGPIFKDISNAQFDVNAGGLVTYQNIIENKYYNENYLISSFVYQFRIALTNLVYEDISDNQDKWNYLYIPDNSGEFIQLGAFGPPYPPTSINFFNTTYQSADISGSTINNADSELNTPFPISYPISTLAVKYQFDLSGSPAIGALQQPVNQNNTVFDVSFVSALTQQNNFQCQLKYSSNWNGTTNPTGRLTELDVYPEHTYELDGSFCMYNVINNDTGTQFDPSCVEIIDVSFTSLRPTRSQANETTQITSEKYFDQQASDTLSFTNSTLTKTTAIGSDGTIYNNVYFINNTDSDTFTLDNEYYTQDNSDNIIGKNADIIPCSKYTFDCSENNANVTDVSVNTLGFSSVNPGITPSGTTHDTSNNDFKITIFNNDIGNGQKKGGYYTFVRIEDNSDTQFIVSQNRYPDSSNNLYEPYNIKIRQEYNTQPPGSEAWIPSGEKTFPFRLGWEHTNTSLNLVSTNVNNPNTSQDFFGLFIPISNPSLDISFDISNRNLWWRGSTSEYTTISTTKLFWNKTVNNSYVEFDEKLKPWASLSSWLPSQTVSETLIIDRVNDLGSSTPNTNSYSRKGISSITPTPMNQFKISLTYANNVPLASPQPAYNETTGTQPLDISFNNLLLFWDYTWRGNTSWISGATLNGPGLTSTLGYNPTDLTGGSGPFGSSYQHGQSLYYNQLMWSGSEQPGSTSGAFRNGNYGSNNENPYISYAPYFDNSTFNYSTLDASGDAVSITYSKGGSPGDYYADFGVTTATVISGVFKWIVLKIQKSASDPNKIQVQVFDPNNTKLNLGEDYMLFLCEEGTQFTTANSQFSGRTGWKDAARKFDTALGSISQNTDGVGIYIVGGNGKLQLFSTNTQTATLYLKIGLANKNSTSNNNVPDVTTQRAISNVSWEFSS